jgi:hypothetical protein
MNEEKVINLSNSSIDYVETSKLVESRIINDKKEMNVIIRNNTIKIRNKDIKYIYHLCSSKYEEGIVFVYNKCNKTSEDNLLISESVSNNISNSFDLTDIDLFKNENRFLYGTFFSLCLSLFFHIISYVYNSNVSRFII